MGLEDAVGLWRDDGGRRRVVEYSPVRKIPFGRITQRVVDGDGRCGLFTDEEEREEREFIKAMEGGGYGGDISKFWD